MIQRPVDKWTYEGSALHQLWEEYLAQPWEVRFKDFCVRLDAAMKRRGVGVGAPSAGKR